MNPPPDSIRVSAAALCWIPINNGCLMEVNPNRGNVVAPFGGALRFTESAVNQLTRIGAVEEKRGARELRLHLPSSRLDEFRIWFAACHDREITPLRELIEELVDEHKVLPSLRPSDIQEMSRQTTLEFRGTSARSGARGAETHFFHEIYLVRFAPLLTARLVESATSKGSRIILVTPPELNRKMSGRFRFPLSESAERMSEAMAKYNDQIKSNDPSNL